MISIGGYYMEGKTHADIAREIGRDVGAVPGNVNLPLSNGTNALIADGAAVGDMP